MLFNPDPTKQAIEMCFSHKRDSVFDPPLTFNDAGIQSTLSQKHFGLVLDSKLDFNQLLILTNLARVTSLFCFLVNLYGQNLLRVLFCHNQVLRHISLFCP